MASVSPFVDSWLSKTFLGYLVFAVLTITLTSASLQPILIQAVFRHGDRSAVESYPNSPYNESMWPQGYGQLSKRGMVQHYNLGQYMKKRYSTDFHLLSEDYKRVEIHIRSTDMDRTLMSAYCHLAGMFPPQQDQLWDSNITWQPIPVHTEPVEEDYILEVLDKCPNFDKAYNKTLHSDRVKKEERDNKEFYQYISKSSGIANETVSSVWGLFDVLNCENKHPELGFKLPEWINKTFKGQTAYDKMKELDSLQFDLLFDGPNRSRLTGGPLLGEMIRNIKMATNDSDPQSPKYYIYSAHDTTVAAVLSAMQVFNTRAPPYAAMGIVELLRDSVTQQLFVQVLYKNESDHDPYNLTLPGCSQICPLDKFVELTKDAIPEDRDKECGFKVDPTLVITQDMFILIIIAVVGVILVTTVIALAIYFLRRRQNRYPRYSAIDTKT